MIYYDFVNYLKQLEKNKSDELLVKIINADVELFTDMKYRFAIQIIKYITKTIDNVYDDIIQEMFSKLYNNDEFSILVMQLKREIEFIYKITEVKSIPEECLLDIINVHKELCEKYDNFIIKSLLETYGEDYASVYESIMCEKEG